MKLIRIFIISLIIFSCSKEQDKILPTETTLTESVYSSVTIQPDSLYQAYAIVAGILDANLVDEGALVSKGETIMQIINNTPKLNSQNAKFALDLAKENYNGSAAILSSIEEEIAAAKLKYKNDSINYFRQKNLWDNNIGSKAEFDARKLNYDLASNNLKLLSSKYNRTKNELLTTVKQAQNNYQTSLITTKDFAVNSKINGKVYALYKEPGEIITTMEPLAAIGSATNFIIEMLVDEVDIVQISEEQDVLINLDAYADKVFKGKVSKIYPQKDQRNQTFKVEAIFENPPEVLYPGLSGEANIVIATKNKVLSIPKSYIIDGNKVKTDEGLVTITTGLQNMELIEVLTGIAKDTYIYNPE
ncbi:efflux RND transporter periplasmic adaptor subunit [Flavobacteriaceae bacterium S0825]|uniref:efflux RND transporter periplasmic adaptor subunit n=1 Tax=Gaetbulibacter sp. S0825 TaxID=2720084 RepID=UPI0014317B97|nr:efflux RND transporter periplasmic adaptor subunit [Gaetbulibacter sp. S0825]MCK0109452.1 efflux RND transporter periplasmic adaptor subunit [Flavobacteriaceae bacterium S0825]NIX65087.1 HlyD family efflux transporter periplasmic adaptor subunit [Gaetbulibacter sp. S0825]